MGLKFSVKKAILSHSMNKRKKNAPFDVEHSDRFEIPPDADDFYNNSHYFSLHSKDSLQSLFVRFARRGGNAPTEVWFWFSDKEGNVYFGSKDHFDKSEKLPFTIEIVEAGKDIRFTYEGNVIRADKSPDGVCTKRSVSEELPAKLAATFFGKSDCFEFSRHMSTEPVARAFAREKWTRSFLDQLKENHQVHYEQEGCLNAELVIGKNSYSFEAERCFRDHSYGKRDWQYFNRYVWIYGMLDNGDVIQCNMVRYPVVKELQTGFYYSAKTGKYVCLRSCTSMDELETSGTCPKALDIRIEFEDGRTVALKTSRQFNTPFLFADGNFLINEGVSKFDADGIKGRGITEFGFNSDKKLWAGSKL